MLGLFVLLGLGTQAFGSFVVFEAAGSVAGANGDFGGVRREVNWDGVPEAFSDPGALPGNFFNVNSARSAVFSTPGTGFMVNANAGGVMPVLFGFPSDFQTFSAEKLFMAVNSTITDVNFFVPGTAIAATSSAFAVILVDVETAGSTKLEFFDDGNNLIFRREALVAGNQGLSTGAQHSKRRRWHVDWEIPITPRFRGVKLLPRPACGPTPSAEPESR